MTPAQIVLAGSGGTDPNAECAKIKASFNPPIVTGTHSEVAAHNKSHKAQTGESYQAEHAVPAANFHVSGRRGTKVDKCDGYSTSKGFCWNAFDNQTELTEHRKLTDAMKDFGNSQGKGFATLEQWKDAYQSAAEDVLKEPPRNPGKTKKERAELAAKAAACLRIEMDKAFEEMKISDNTRLRNGIVSGPPPPATRGTKGKTAI